MIPENLMPPTIQVRKSQWKDPFNFFPTDWKKKPNYRVEYIYIDKPNCHISSSSPAIFTSDEEAIETAYKNADEKVREIKVEKYTENGLINIWKKIK